jgi:hypothetical protein
MREEISIHAMSTRTTVLLSARFSYSVNLAMRLNSKMFGGHS